MKRLIIFIIGGIVFGFGLALSGMAKPEVVLSFLSLDDFGLMLVMGGAILVTMPIYQLYRKPLLADKPETFTAWLNPRPIAGSVLFGVGWGIAGVCPGVLGPVARHALNLHTRAMCPHSDQSAPASRTSLMSFETTSSPFVSDIVFTAEARIGSPKSRMKPAASAWSYVAA